ncbi:hypothetical protein [Candidatus Finniella inopinata]|uniref:Uncharacterized protein n=1 Tax=Candidatus Finniella inopinata TaxID=1696036 RepID=A0A4Q7DHB1_9PROT|nr:hypothetical protein [Candidatus Finniella inopinata]RZI45710.1 hypothetical protein EQU50_06310 [Candidatus Finniella inopinata]
MASTGYASETSSLSIETWQGRFARLAKTAKSSTIGQESATVLDDLAKNAETLENRQAVLSLMPDLFRAAPSFTMATSIRETLSFLISNATDNDEKLLQIWTLDQLGDIRREYPPSPEDVTNQERVQEMLVLLANVNNPKSVRIGAINGLKKLIDPMILSPKVQENLVVFSNSLLSENGSAEADSWIRVKGVLILTRLGVPLEFQPLMDVLQATASPTFIPDMLYDMAEGLKYLSKTETTLVQRSQVMQVLQPLTQHFAPHVRLQVAEAYRELSKKASTLAERQAIRQILTLLAKDTEYKIRKNTAASLQLLVEKETDLSERGLILAVIQDLLGDKVVNVQEYASYACKALVKSAQGDEERRTLIKFAPSLLSNSCNYVVLSGLSSFRALADKAITSEERLFIANQLHPRFTQSENGDFLNYASSIFSILAVRATIPSERQLVADGLIQLIGGPVVWGIDLTVNGLVMLFETEQKDTVKACAEKFMGHNGLKILEVLSRTEKTTEDFDWIKQTYLNYIELENPQIWYLQEEVISSFKKLCQRISDSDERSAVEQELAKILQVKEQKERARHKAFVDSVFR